MIASAVAVVNSVAATIAQAVSDYVIAPAMAAVAYVNDVVIKPMTDKVTSMGLGFAIDTFCSSVVVPMFPDLGADALGRCKLSGGEELMKGFDSAAWAAL